MTEQEWLTSEDPVAMLDFLTYRPSASKFDPYTMPMGRRREPIVSDRQLRLFIDTRKCDRCKIWLSRSVLNNALHCSTADCNTLRYSCNLLREIVGNPFLSVSVSREIPYIAGVVNAYAPVGWLTPKVHDMAQHIYDFNEWDLMPQLGDLLEESGCDNEEILRHCWQEEQCFTCKGSREEMASDSHGYMGYAMQCRKCQTGWIPKRTPCVKGCWVVDLLLGNN